MRHARAMMASALIVVLTGGTVAWAAGPGSNAPVDTRAAADAQAQRHATFQQEVLPLRQKLMQLRTELVALEAQSSPDWTAIAAKQKEMVDVRVEIQKRAYAAGLAPGSGRGRGMAFGGGRGMAADRL